MEMNKGCTKAILIFITLLIIIGMVFAFAPSLAGV